MKLEIQREQLLQPLQKVVGVVERRQTLPILSNVLIAAQDDELNLITTDLEVELRANTELAVNEPGRCTLSARKLLDILRALPESSTITLMLVEGDKAVLRCGRSRFSLATLPPADFPTLEDLPFSGQLNLPEVALKNLMERTHFAMAQQDVRYYLNGMLLDIADGKVRAVATDGHRLAYCEVATHVDFSPQQLIIPRKGVLELMRLLGDSEDEIAVSIGTNHIQANLKNISFTSKLIDGKFPDYHRVIPREGEYIVVAERLALRAALARAAILSTEKYRGIRFHLEDQMLRVQAHNPEQEEAEEEIEVNYSGDSLEIGFNVAYLLDALGALTSNSVTLSLTNASSSCMLREPDSEACKYVIMPMRL